MASHIRVLVHCPRDRLSQFSSAFGSPGFDASTVPLSNVIATSGTLDGARTTGERIITSLDLPPLLSSLTVSILGRELPQLRPCIFSVYHIRYTRQTALEAETLNVCTAGYLRGL